MKFFLLLLFVSTFSWARPVVLLAHFDSFGRAPFNNSENIAKNIFKTLKLQNDIDIKLCGLNTIFDKSFYQLETCLRELQELPSLVLALGESNCQLKIETLSRNLDHSKGPDNDGIERRNEIIIPGANKALPFTYPLPEMYCSLTPQDRRYLNISNNAGSFVCNNLAFLFSNYYPNLSFGFIHVPAHNCQNLPARSKSAESNLVQMITAALNSKSHGKLATTKNEYRVLRDRSINNKCHYEFYNRARGIDE
jgi:pyroglutamyl-peptidase